MNWKREASEQGLILLFSMAVSFAVFFAASSLGLFHG